MRITPDLTATQIVIIGKFNPELFSLEWMEKSDLLGKTESRAAEVKVADKGLVDISTDWCRIFSTPEKFVVVSQQAPWIRLSDLCLKIFVELLPDTKVAFMGINRTVQFNTGSMKARDQLGRLLAPRSAWGEWGKILEKDEGKGASGLSTLTMRQGHALEDRAAGYIEVRVAPGEGSSVVINVNDHYAVPKDEEATAGGELMRRLAENFETSIRRADNIVDGIMAQVNS